MYYEERRRLLFYLALTSAAAAMLTQTARSQEDARFKVVKDETIIVHVRQGSLITAQFTVARAVSADEENFVVTPLTIENIDGDVISTPHVFVSALTHGVTHVTLWSIDPAVPPVILRIEAVSDEKRFQALEDFIKQHFPNLEVKLLPVPTSDKLLVMGAVENDDQAANIISLITSDEFTEDQIVDMLVVP